MIAKILTVEKDSVVIDEVVLSVPEFKKIWELYKDITPFQYLWAMYDPNSPYMNYTEDEREMKVLEDFPGNYSVNDYEMHKAIKKCEELYFSPVRRLLKGTKTGVDKLSAYFEEMTIDSGLGGNLAQVKSALVDMPKIIKAYLEAESAYRQELQKSRGEIRRGIDDDYQDNYDD